MMPQDWYLKSLAIRRRPQRPAVPGQPPTINLVVLYVARGGWTDAQEWYQKSLAIEEKLGDRPGMASTYQELGMVAQARGELDTAAEWYQKSLAIKEELSDRSARP